MAAPKGNQFAKGNKGGQPPIQLSDLPEGWKQSIINLSKEGAAIIELSVELGISRPTFYALSEREEEFFDTVNKCKDLSEAWWMRQGRVQLENKDFSFTGWYMNMKNRFGWSDKQEVNQTTVQINSVPMSKDEINDISNSLEDEY